MDVEFRTDAFVLMQSRSFPWWEINAAVGNVGANVQLLAEALIAWDAREAAPELVLDYARNIIDRLVVNPSQLLVAMAVIESLGFAYMLLYRLSRSL